MISLVRPPEPASLQAARAELLLALANGNAYAKSPWRKADVLAALHQASHGKCAYCETPVGDAQSMEVDHFVAQTLAGGDILAATWTNLLPSCHDCNNRKKAVDVRNIPFLDPFTDDPRLALSFHGGRLKALTPQGVNTVLRLRLNQRRTIEYQRIWNAVSEQVEKLLEVLGEVDQGTLTLTPTRSARCSSEAISILESAGPSAQYAAVIATRLNRCADWRTCETLLRVHHIWDRTMETLKQNYLECVLPG